MRLFLFVTCLRIATKILFEHKNIENISLICYYINMLKRLFVIFCLVVTIFMFTGCKEIEATRTTHFCEDDVAVLSVFSFDGGSESAYGIKNLGHSFLSIKNISNDNIILAGKTIVPNEEIYFGAWSLSVHFGIWFNVESNYIEFYNKYNGRISIEKGIEAEDLETIGEYILNNDTWNPLKNCSHFAIGCWNSVAKEDEKLGLGFINTPSNLIKQLKAFVGFKVNKELNFYSGCGYFADLTEDAFVFEGGEIYV